MSEPAANPYMWLAANIAAGLDGIERGAARHRRSWSATRTRRRRSCCRSRSARRPNELDAAQLYRAAFGDPLVDYIVMMKRAEVARYASRRRRRRPRAATGRCASTSRPTDVPPARARRPAADDRGGGDRAPPISPRSPTCRRATPTAGAWRGGPTPRRSRRSGPPARTRAVGGAREDPAFHATTNGCRRRSRSSTCAARRRGSRSGLENCHPFVRDRAAFAQNGALYPQERLPSCCRPSVEATIEGSTDSERLFRLFHARYLEGGRGLPGGRARHARARCCRPTPRPC